jgi:hypothetical protein
MLFNVVFGLRQDTSACVAVVENPTYFLAGQVQQPLTG